MRAFTRAWPAVMVVATLAAACAACSSSSASPTPAGAGSASQAAEARPRPFTITYAAGGKVHLASRPDAIILLSPTAPAMPYAIGAVACQAATAK